MNKYSKENRKKLHAGTQKRELIDKVTDLANSMSNQTSMAKGNGKSKVVKKEDPDRYDPAKVRAARAKKGKKTKTSRTTKNYIL